MHPLETKRAPTASIALHTESWSSFGRSPRDPPAPSADDAPTTHNTPHRFPPRPDLNAALRVWISDRASPCELDADAFVCVTNERLEPVDPPSRAVFDDAGPGFARDLASLGGCRTGEAKCVPARDHPARHIILTVGPRYADKYRTAAENALSHCYRGALECAVEADARTVAVPVVYSDAKGYPRAHGAHVAARTLRRFLERWPGKLDAVVLCVDERDEKHYVGTPERPGTLRMYFPRDDVEATRAEETLPEDVGNEHGEARNAERDITISSFPATKTKTLGKESVVGFGSTRATSPSPSPSASFLGKVESPESRRARLRRGDDDEPEDDWFWGDDLAVPRAVRGSPPPSPSKDAARDARARRERLLSEASETDLSDVESSGAVRVAGRDFVGRRVVTVDAATVERANAEGRGRRVLMYAAKTLAPVVADPRGWILVYFHSGGRWGAPDADFVEKLCDAVGPGHEETLRMMYVVHPTTMLRAGIWLGVAFGAVSEGVFGKAEYVHRLADLAGFVDDDQMVVPEHARAHDRDLVEGKA